MGHEIEGRVTRRGRHFKQKKHYKVLSSFSFAKQNGKSEQVDIKYNESGVSIVV